MKDKTVIRNVILMTVIWSFGSFAFFMIPFYLDEVQVSDIYIMSFAMELAELISGFICVAIIKVMTN